MSEGVQVLAISALREFALRYKNFAQNLLQILDQLEWDFRHRWEALEQAYRLQQRRVEHLRHLLETADEEESSFYRARLTEAEERLEEMRAWLRQLQEQYQAYRQRAQQVRELATQLAPKATTFLQGRASELEAYVAVTLPGAETYRALSLAGSSAPTPSSGEATVMASPTPAPPDMTRYALPPGFQWVPLAEIALEDFPEDDEFSKVSAEEMRAGMAKLPEVLEILKDRLHLPPQENSTYLGRLDRRAGRTPSEGLQRVYEAFFGEPINVIRLSRRQGETFWTVENGRHRIRLARELGWTAVPASVKEVGHEGVS